MLPLDILEFLEEINGGSSFLEDIWVERFERLLKQSTVHIDEADDVIGNCCKIIKNLNL